MNTSRQSYASRKRMLMTVKVAALVAALGFVTVMLEQPRLTASPSHPRATSERSLDSGRAQTTSPSAVGAAVTGESLSAPSSESQATYFPGQFAQPGGTVDQHPASF